MIKTMNLHSPLASQIKKLIERRQSCGMDYRTQAKLLTYFDRFLVQENIKKALDPPIRIVDMLAHDRVTGAGQTIGGAAVNPEGTEVGITKELTKQIVYPRRKTLDRITGGARTYMDLT